MTLNSNFNPHQAIHREVVIFIRRGNFYHAALFAQGLVGRLFINKFAEAQIVAMQRVVVLRRPIGRLRNEKIEQRR